MRSVGLHGAAPDIVQTHT